MKQLHHQKHHHPPQNQHTTVKPSTIPNAGEGLFALEDIPKGTKIAEFKGLLNKRFETKSIVYFNDGAKLFCFSDCIASKANDCVKIPSQKRSFKEMFEGENPLYESHTETGPNANIDLDDKNHRAYLVSKRLIKKDEEIFVHYGFMWWIKTERNTIGFTGTSFIFDPRKFFDYIPVQKYMKIFYPDAIKTQVGCYKGQWEAAILMSEENGGSGYILPFDQLATRIQ